jgi:hypothetical protein
MGLIGCATPESPYKPKSSTPPARKYCFDSIGHVRGSKPWILGGTCCCTPSRDLLGQYQDDGFCGGMTLEELINVYQDRGIITGLDHQGCNNACRWGPHVLKGGKCMVPPSPGTRNFEEIATGTRYVSRSPERKQKE